MTEFALILAIQVAALAYSLAVGRGVLAAGISATRLRRLGSALERAGASFSARQARALGVAAASLSLVTFVLHLSLGTSELLARIPAGLSAALGVAVGAGLCWTAAHVALRLGVGASVQVAVASSRSLDHALSLAIRAGGAASLCAEALSGLGLIAVFGTLFALLGGTTLPLKDGMALAQTVTGVLTSVPLGAALAALVCQRSGSLFQTAVDIGGDVAAEQRFGLTRDDPRNPVLVGGLSGSHLGESATRAALLFVSTTTTHVALLALGLATATRDGSPSLPLLFLPFVVRAFFVLASAFGISVVRTEEMTTPSGAIARGYLSTSVIGLSGLCGASLWLQKEHFWVFLGAGSVGIAASWLLTLPVWARLLRPAVGPREAAEALRVSSGSAAIASLGSALQTALLPLAAVGVAATLSFHLGERAGFVSGGVWTSLVTWAALLGSAPFAFAASSVATIADGAPAVAAMAGASSEAQRRSLRLDEMQGIGASARAQLISNIAVAAVLSAFAVPALAREELRLQIALFEPVVTWSGGIGAAFVLAYAGASARHALRGARELVAEVDRQLRKFPREHGVSLIPADFSPSYKACIDLSARFAFVRLAPEALCALAAPAALALTLRVAYGGSKHAIAIEGLMSCVLFAGLAGFTAALAFDLARSTLNSACRAARARAGSDPLFAIAGDGAANLFGHAAGPATQALLVVTAALALAAAPFLN